MDYKLPRIGKKRFNVESKKAQKRNAKNYETDIIIAEGIETLGYFFCVGHKQSVIRKIFAVCFYYFFVPVSTLFGDTLQRFIIHIN